MSREKTTERGRYDREKWRMQNQRRIDTAKTVLVLGLVVMTAGFIILNWR
ncbi:hypothetical protein [Sinomonas mesophila]|nr:hypothetical protein [Sinomonas mesophila]